MELSVEAEWWEVVVAVKYESATGEVLVEEAIARIDNFEGFPLSFQIGRTVLPFGESETRFNEDALVMVIGETDEASVIMGVEHEVFEASVGVYKGEERSGGKCNLVALARMTSSEFVEFGASFSSDLSESVELSEIYQEMSEAQADHNASHDVVAGLGTMALLSYDRMFMNLEYVTALESFDAGYLQDDSTRPWALTAECGIECIGKLNFSARLETAHDLPGHPEWQYGAAASYELYDPLSCNGSYLYGRFDEGRNRHVVTFALAFEY